MEVPRQELASRHFRAPKGSRQWKFGTRGQSPAGDLKSLESPGVEPGGAVRASEPRRQGREEGERLRADTARTGGEGIVRPALTRLSHSLVTDRAIPLE